MKKHHEVKKLTLNRETLRQLDPREADQVQGGVTTAACTVTATCFPRNCPTLISNCC